MAARAKTNKTTSMGACDYARCSSCGATYTRDGSTYEGRRRFSSVLNSHERSTGHKYFSYRNFTNPSGVTFADKIAELPAERVRPFTRHVGPSHGGSQL